MLNQATLDKLHALRLTGMAEAYQKQLEEPEARGLNFEERFGMLVDNHWTCSQLSHQRRSSRHPPGNRRHPPPTRNVPAWTPGPDDPTPAPTLRPAAPGDCPATRSHRHSRNMTKDWPVKSRTLRRAKGASSGPLRLIRVLIMNEVGDKKSKKRARPAPPAGRQPLSYVRGSDGSTGRPPRFHGTTEVGGIWGAAAGAEREVVWTEGVTRKGNILCWRDR